MTFCIACGPSVAEFENLKSENAVLKAQVDSLNQELDAFKYSPEKLLADAQLAVFIKVFKLAGVLQILHVIGRASSALDHHACAVVKQIGVIRI